MLIRTLQRLFGVTPMRLLSLLMILTPCHAKFHMAPRIGFRPIEKRVILHFEVRPDRRVEVIAEYWDKDRRPQKTRQRLPEAFRQEETAFRVKKLPNGTIDRDFRVIYRSGDSDYIVGFAMYTTFPDKEDRSPYVDLTQMEEGKAWGFDRAMNQFWFKPDISKLPLRPEPFDEISWRGCRFWIAKPLQKKAPEQARALIENHGGRLVTHEGPVDVIVLPDGIDFTFDEKARHRGAEQWIAKGARVLYEADFWLGPFIETTD